MARGKKPVRPPSPDPVVENLLDLRDRVEAQAKADVLFARGRPFVLMVYAFRLLARRRRQLGLEAIRELAPWLAKLVRSRAIEGGTGSVLAACFWDSAPTRRTPGSPRSRRWRTWCRRRSSRCW